MSKQLILEIEETALKEMQAFLTSIHETIQTRREAGDHGESAFNKIQQVAMQIEQVLRGQIMSATSAAAAFELFNLAKASYDYAINILGYMRAGSLLNAQDTALSGRVGQAEDLLAGTKPIMAELEQFVVNKLAEETLGESILNQAIEWYEQAKYYHDWVTAAQNADDTQYMASLAQNAIDRLSQSYQKIMALPGAKQEYKTSVQGMFDEVAPYQSEMQNYVGQIRGKEESANGYSLPSLTN